MGTYDRRSTSLWLKSLVLGVVWYIWLKDDFLARSRSFARARFSSDDFIGTAKELLYKIKDSGAASALWVDQHSWNRWNRKVAKTFKRFENWIWLPKSIWIGNFVLIQRKQTNIHWFQSFPNYRHVRRWTGEFSFGQTRFAQSVIQKISDFLLQRYVQSLAFDPWGKRFVPEKWRANPFCSFCDLNPQRFYLILVR
jgi:hypothetical protein